MVRGGRWGRGVVKVGASVRGGVGDGGGVVGGVVGEERGGVGLGRWRIEAGNSVADLTVVIRDMEKVMASLGHWPGWSPAILSFYDDFSYIYKINLNFTNTFLQNQNRIC